METTHSIRSFSTQPKGFVQRPFSRHTDSHAPDLSLSVDTRLKQKMRQTFVRRHSRVQSSNFLEKALPRKMLVVNQARELRASQDIGQGFEKIDAMTNSASFKQLEWATNDQPRNRD